MSESYFGNVITRIYIKNMKMSVGDFISKSVGFELKTCPNRVKKTVQHRILYDIRLLFDFVNVIILIESL